MNSEHEPLGTLAALVVSILFPSGKGVTLVARGGLPSHSL